MRLFLALILLAVVAPPAAANGIGPLLKNGELHRSARDGRDTRYDLWRFSPDGSFTGSYQIHRPVARSFYIIEGSVTGTWKYDDNQLCVEASGLEKPALYEALDNTTPARICYELRRTGVATSGNEYVATNTATGANWQMFIYPRTRY